MKYLLLLSLLISIHAKAITSPLPEYCPKTMTVVFYGDWYPYMFREQDGYKGIDYEFMKLVLDQLRCKVVVDSLPEKRAHQGLARGDSLIMSGATITQERQKYAYFSNPYRGESISLFYLTDSQNDTIQPDEVVAQSKMIAINGAAYYGPYIAKKRQGQHADKFVHVPSVEKRIEMMTRKRAQAIVEDHVAGCFYFDKQGLTIPDKVKWLQVNQVNVAFMFSKGVVPYEFIAIFNKTMQQLLEQGKYDEIAAKYTPRGC